MSFKTTAVLFGLLLAVLFYFGLVLAWNKTSKDIGLLVPSLAKDGSQDIDSVTIKRDGQEYHFYKKNDAWVLRIGSGEQELRVDEDKIAGIINQVRQAKKSDEADIDRNLSSWGLAPPKAVVILKKGAGTEYVVNVGDVSADKAFVYMNSAERPREVLAVRRKAVKDLLFDDINEFRNLKLLDVTDANAQSITITDLKDKKTLALEKNKDATWKFTQPPLGPADFAGGTFAKGAQTGVKGLLMSAGVIRVPSDKDFEPVGKVTLDEKDAHYRIDVVRSAGGGFGKQEETVKETLFIGAKVGEKDKEQYLVRMSNESAVARANAKPVDAVLEVFNKPDNLRSKDLMETGPAKTDVVEMGVGKDLKEQIYLVKSSPFGWEVVSGTNRHKAGMASVNDLINGLEGKEQIKEFFDPANAEDAKKLDAKLGFDNSTFKIALFTDAFAGEEKKEDPKDKKVDPKDQKEDKKDTKEQKKDEKEQKKDDKKDDDKAKDEPKDTLLPGGFKLKAGAKPAVTLLFGNKDGDKVYVKRIGADGTENRVAVPATMLEKAYPAQGVLAFFDNRLTPFDASDVAKLELARADVKFVVEREPPKAKDKDKKEDGKDKDKKDLPDELKNLFKDKKEEKPEPDVWNLIEPKDLPNRPHAAASEVETILDILDGLTAKKWIKQIGPKDSLAEFGLDKPFLVASVTMKKKEVEKPEKKDDKVEKKDDKKGEKKDDKGEKKDDKGEKKDDKGEKKDDKGEKKDGEKKEAEPTTLVYRFGSKTFYDKDKVGIYAMQTGGDNKDLVFMVPIEAIKALEEGELRDRTVLKFDADKVKELKVAFPPSKTGPVEPVFELKDGSWVAVKGVGEKFAFDSFMVRSLLRTLSDLKAEKYVVTKGGPQEPHGLGAKAVLKLDALMDDGKTRHTLAIGAQSGKSYYAESNLLPGVIFLVPEAIFQPIIQKGVDYFSR